jgi:hypothetical protein
MNKTLKVTSLIVLIFLVGIIFINNSFADCPANCAGTKTGKTNFGKSCTGNRDEGFCFSCSANCRYDGGSVSCGLGGGKVKCPRGIIENTVDRCFATQKACNDALKKSNSTGLCQAGEDPVGPAICDLCIQDKCPSVMDSKPIDRQPEF